jgi:hypothetical protein
MNLMMAKVERCYAIDLLNKDIQPESIEGFKNLNFKTFSVSCK